MSNQDISQYGTACCFDKTGDNVLIGTSKGIVYIVNVHTREVRLSIHSNSYHLLKKLTNLITSHRSNISQK